MSKAISVAEPNRHPIFGVYRGQGIGNQSCTIAILEQRSIQLVAFLVDQNPHVYVSTSEMLEKINANTSKVSLLSVERDFKDQVEFVFDSKSKRIEVTTITSDVTAKCHKAIQIRRQD